MTNIQLNFFLPVLIVMCVPACVSADEWNGISPTVSTRSDVVRLFQKCQESNEPCDFDFKSDRIRIVFSGSVQDYFYPCSGHLPPGTVLLVEVTPKKPIPLKSLRKRYRLTKLRSTSEFSAYFDERAGLILKTLRSQIVQLNYVAHSSNRTRCADYYNDPLRFATVVTHCPPISLEASSAAVTVGDVLTLKANVQIDPKMALLWNTSDGKILSRNGNQLTVDTSGLNSRTLTVTVQAVGSCSVETSMTVQIASRAP